MKRGERLFDKKKSSLLGRVCILGKLRETVSLVWLRKMREKTHSNIANLNSRVRLTAMN